MSSGDGDNRAAGGGRSLDEPPTPVAEIAAKRSRRNGAGAGSVGDQRRRAAEFGQNLRNFRYLRLEANAASAAFSGGGALIGIAYCGRALARISRRFAAGRSWEDRAFYALIPLFGYLVLLASAILEIVERPAEADALAGVAVIVLIAAGRRNAWDTTVRMTARAATAAPPGGRRALAATVAIDSRTEAICAKSARRD